MNLLYECLFMVAYIIGGFLIGNVLYVIISEIRSYMVWREFIKNVKLGTHKPNFKNENI